MAAEKKEDSYAVANVLVELVNGGRRRELCAEVVPSYVPSYGNPSGILHSNQSLPLDRHEKLPFRGVAFAANRRQEVALETPLRSFDSKALISSQTPL
jgi:hypothetical protein